MQAALFAGAPGTSVAGTLLATDARTAALMVRDAAVLLAAALPAIGIPRVDCTRDAWTAWSPCLPACGRGQGVRDRARRCPLRAETEFCALPPCANCSHANGGCPAAAVCNASPVDGTAVCTCAAAFVQAANTSSASASALACEPRSAAQDLVLRGQFRYPFSLTLVAATAAARAAIDATLRGLLATVLDIPAARVGGTRLAPVSDVAFTYNFLLLAPTVADEPTAADLAVKLADRVAAGSFDLNFAGVTRPGPTVTTATDANVPAAAVAVPAPGWTRHDTVHLLIALGVALLAASIVIGGLLVRRERATARAAAVAAGLAATMAPTAAAAAGPLGGSLLAADASVKPPPMMKRVSTGSMADGHLRHYYPASPAASP